MHSKLKIKYDFNDAAVLEVEYAPGKKARVTANHFRSYTGPRFINNQPYTGPIYYEGTNNKYKLKKQDNVRIVSITELNGKKAVKRIDMITIGVNSRI